MMAIKAQKLPAYGDKKARITWLKKAMLSIFDLMFNGHVAQLVRAQHS